MLFLLQNKTKFDYLKKFYHVNLYSKLLAYFKPFASFLLTLDYYSKWNYKFPQFLSIIKYENTKFKRQRFRFCQPVEIRKSKKHLDKSNVTPILWWHYYTRILIFVFMYWLPAGSAHSPTPQIKLCIQTNEQYVISSPIIVTSNKQHTKFQEKKN